MFEKEIKFIFRMNAERVEGLGAFATFEQLNSIELHPAILCYISAEIDYLIFEDRKKLLKDSVFDYSGESIQHHFSMIDREIKNRKRFSIEYIKKLILHAASFNVNYLVRPKWSLLRIIFEEETRKTTEEIVQILNYVYFYDYLKKIITSYLKKKRIHSINVHDFEEILDKIDQLEVESYLDTIYERALSSMAEFFDTGGLTAGRIPLKAMEMFLDEKRLTEPLQYLRDYLPGTGNQYFDPVDLKKILKGDFDGFRVEEKKEEELPEPEIVEEEPKASEEEQTENIDKRLDKYEFTFEEEAEEELELDQAELREEIDAGEFAGEPIKEDEQESADNSLDYDEELQGLENSTDDGSVGEAEIDSQLTAFDDEDIAALESEPSDESISEPKNSASVFSINAPETTLNTETQPDDEDVDKYEKLTEAEDETILQADEPLEISESEAAPPEGKAVEQHFLTEFLESKDVSKIVDSVFDSDMEFFLHTTDLISGSSNKDEAFEILDRVLKSNYVNPASKEAQKFKAIISEYFESLS